MALQTGEKQDEPCQREEKGFERTHRKALRKTIFIHHEDEMTAFMAPHRARMAKTSMNDLESLYGPQQIITRVFHKRQVGTQEQFLVRWTPTFMLKPHIQVYRNALYETESITDVKGYLHHNISDICLVSWKDSWEPGEVVRNLKHLDGSVISIDQLSKSQAPKQLQSKPKDLHLHNLDRQSFKGTSKSNVSNPFVLDASLQKHVTIRTGESINPDLDIATPGFYTIRADPRPLPVHDSQPICPLHIVYGPDGKAIGSITADRLIILYRCFQQFTTNTSSQQEEGFPKAIASLLARYRDGRMVGQYQVRMQNYLTTPPTLMSAIKRGFNTDIERFACPLNFDQGMKSYFSPFCEDGQFGASHDAYSQSWTGSSQASPEYSAEAMQKAVRWALASADQHAKASLTVFVLPFYEKGTTSYQQFLGHPLVHKVAQFPRHAIRLQSPVAWSTGKLLEDQSKRDMILFVVANSLGLMSYLDDVELHAGLQSMMAETNMNFDYAILIRVCAQASPTSLPTPRL